MKVKSQSEVAQSRLTLRNPMDCSLPDSSVHGIFQARVLEWAAIALSVNLFLAISITSNMQMPPPLSGGEEKLKVMWRK